jgi:putative transcriptional regulator
MAKRKTSPILKAIIETADGLHRVGLLDDAAHAKITLRHFGEYRGSAEPMSGEEIRRVRQDAHLSQAVFARCLNVTTGYVSQLERGTKQPTGAALALLNVIRRKGIESVL